MLNKLLRSRFAPVVLFALAAGLILFGGVNGVAAAPAIQSQWFGAQVELNDIDVALIENGAQVHGDGTAEGDLPLFTSLLKEGEKFKVGNTYATELAVRNMHNSLNNGVDGERIIDEYVRVTVYQYWEKKDADGKWVKAPELDPALIKIGWKTDDGWTIDNSDGSNTSERTVLYYSKVLGTDEKTRDSSPFATSLTIDGSVASNADYYGARFVVRAVVHAVQTHNADDARMSAWGQIDAKN